MRAKPRKLTDNQIEKLKEILLKEKESLIFNGVYVSDEFNVDREDLSDDVDYANSTLHSAQQLRFRNREVFYANKIESALERIEAGEYGKCEECEGNIGFRRLSARPTADQCINCKEENEKSEQASVFGRISKSFDISRTHATV